MTSEFQSVVIVTGGAVRLGRGIVQELASSGWNVVFTFKSSAQPAAELENKLTSQGCAVKGVCADIDEKDQRASVLDETLTLFGRLDALINSAAIFPRTPISDLDEATFSRVLRTNLQAPLFFALECAPHLREARGNVVNIADIYGAFPLRDHLAYSVAKAGLIAATRSLAVELAPEVRVNAVAPGIAVFPDDYDEKTKARLLDRTLLKREGSAAEIARAVHYLLDGTSTMTGQVLTLDGGRTIAL